MLAGFGGVLVGGVYGILIVPLVIVFVADQRKLLVWQMCIVPFALYIAAMNGLQAGVFFLFWALGSVISSPVPVYLYWKRSKAQGGHQLAWLFLGLVFVGLICLTLLRDPFLFVGLSVLWIAGCLGRFAWQWRATVESGGPKAGTLIASGVLLFAILTATSVGFLRKQEAFRAAMDHHYLGIARLFVKMGADPSLPDALGHTALVAAAWNGVGDLAGVNALIAMGANVNQTQSRAFNGLMPSGTALHVAASSGRKEICESLLKAGASTDAPGTNGQTPLLAALSHGSINCVPTLLQYGANVNAKDGQGKTALMLLMNYGPDDPAILNILQLMLAKGAEVDAKDVDGRSVEDWAAYYKHERFEEPLRNFPNPTSNGSLRNKKLII
jgi:ankyrin repeat protein